MCKPSKLAFLYYVLQYCNPALTCLYFVPIIYFIFSVKGTSNWSGDYFTNTAGVGIVVRAAPSKNDTSTNPVRDQLQQVFERDWNCTYASPLV